MSILKPLAQLPEGQKEFIEFCREREHNVFLEGPPWSGKSLVCLYTLQNIVKENDISALFMVSNNAMFGYMSMALRELEVDKNVNVETKNKFFWKMASKTSMSVNMELDYHNNYDSILTGLLEEELDEEYEQKYDLVIVNEVQDYLTKEWELIKRISKRIVCYGDFRQAIYDDKVSRETIVKDCVHKQLHYLQNNQWTNKLTRVRDYFFGDADYLKSSDENSYLMQPLATDMQYNTIDIKYKDELRTVAEIIVALEGKNSRTAIICPNNNRFDELSIYLGNKNIKHTHYAINKELRHHDFTCTVPLFISLFNAEGFQFDNAILFGFNEENYIVEMKREEGKLNNLLYVALTRAKYTTYIIRNENTVKELKEFDGESI